MGSPGVLSHARHSVLPRVQAHRTGAVPHFPQVSGAMLSAQVLSCHFRIGILVIYSALTQCARFQGVKYPGTQVLGKRCALL